jgi:hypothetical protein
MSLSFAVPSCGAKVRFPADSTTHWRDRVWRLRVKERVAVGHGALLLVEQFRSAHNASLLGLPGDLVDIKDTVGAATRSRTHGARAIEETGSGPEP